MRKESKKGKEIKEKHLCQIHKIEPKKKLRV
jgi:hypothetical protein